MHPPSAGQPDGRALQFRLLGPFEVALDGRLLDIGRPKQRAVLANLLLHANTVVSVDRFTDVLWPDGPPPRSTGNLPVYIANLRRLIEPERPARTAPQRILTRAPGYLVRVGAGEYDVADFERLRAEGSRHLVESRPRAARRALADGLALWRGRAMEEFPFAEMEAARLDGARVAATEDRIAADLVLGAHLAVIGELEHLIGEHGLRERLVELLMLALYRSGRQSDALRAYATARDRLREELGLEPGPDLRRLEAEILAQSPALDWHPPAPEGVAAPVDTGPPPAPADPFVGRAAELAAIRGALGGPDGGPGAVVLVAGEPGIGKTRLVREALTAAADRGWAVAWGRCDEVDVAPPFGPWIQVIRALLAHPDTGVVRAAVAPSAAEIGQLVPEVKELVGELAPPPPLDQASARFRQFEAVGDFLARLAHQLGVVVVLDDLHWADPPSLQLAGHLARRLAGQPAHLVITYRDVDPAPNAGLRDLLASLARQPGRVDLSLTGLSHEEVAEFVAHEAGVAPSAGVLAAVWDRSGGNPFFVGELTRLLVAERTLTVPSPTTAGVPWAVRQVVGRRMERLPEPTQQLLVVAAVAGTDFDLRVVARAAGVSLDQALDLVDVAVAAGLVAEVPGEVGRFGFSHAIVQETIYGDLAGLRRAGLHGSVADALEEAGGTGRAIEIVHHLYEAAPVLGPERAIAAAGRASAAAQGALAYEVAEDHLRRALALVTAMAEGPERDGYELDVQVQLAVLLTVVKGVAVPETAAAWERATELCLAVEDQRRLLLSLWGLLTFAWASGDLDGARSLADHMLQLERSSADPVVTTTAQLGLGLVALSCGDLAGGTAHLAAAKEVVDALDDHLLVDVTFADLRVQVDSWLSMACHLRGDHAGGRRLADGAVKRAGTTGGPFTMATGLSFAVVGRVLSAEPADGRRLAEELIDLADRLQVADFTYHGRVVRAWAMAHMGAPEDEVVALLDDLPPALAAGIRPWHPFWLALTAEVWQGLGRPAEALRLVGDAMAEIDAMGASFSVAEVLRLRGELTRAMAPARLPEAQADLDEAARLASEQGAALYLDRAMAAGARLPEAGGPERR